MADSYAETWVTVNWPGAPEGGHGVSDLYIASCYFAVMTMSTIGYGDITPANPVEEVVASIFMLIGALCAVPSMCAHSMWAVLCRCDVLRLRHHTGRPCMPHRSP